MHPYGMHWYPTHCGNHGVTALPFCILIRRSRRRAKQFPIPYSLPLQQRLTFMVKCVQQVVGFFAVWCAEEFVIQLLDFRVLVRNP